MGSILNVQPEDKIRKWNFVKCCLSQNKSPSCLYKLNFITFPIVSDQRLENFCTVHGSFRKHAQSYETFTWKCVLLQ